MYEHYAFNRDYTSKLLDSGYVPSLCFDFRSEIEIRVPLCIDIDVRAYEERLRMYKQLVVLLRTAKINMKDFEGSEFDNVDICTHRIADDLLEEINSIIGVVDPDVACIMPSGQIIKVDDNPGIIKSPELIVKEFNDYCKNLKPIELKEYIKDIHMYSEEEFSQRVHEFYNDDAFADRIKLPYVSYKINRKFRGEMTSSDNPVSLADTGFKTYGDLENDIRNNPKSSYYVRFNRGIDETLNFTIYDARRYYCMEIYVDCEGKYQVRGIRYVDLYRDSNKHRLVLKKSLPSDCKHIVYVFKNEYIKVFKKGKLINNGFGAYRGVENINHNTGKIRLYSNRNLQNRDVYIPLNGDCKKIEMSILGHIIGERKCGDLSLFMTEST